MPHNHAQDSDAKKAQIKQLQQEVQQEAQAVKELEAGACCGAPAAEGGALHMGARQSPGEPRRCSRAERGARC